MRSRADEEGRVTEALGSREQTVPEEHHVIIVLIAQHLGMPAELTSQRRGVAADVIADPRPLQMHPVLLSCAYTSLHSFPSVAISVWCRVIALKCFVVAIRHARFPLKPPKNLTIPSVRCDGSLPVFFPNLRLLF